MPTIEVKGQALPSEAAPYTIDEIDGESIRSQAVSTPEATLNDVPGVSVNSYGLGGVANVISMRGFSNGQHGGGIGFVVDGIPLNEALSHADGYADQNVLIPLEIDTISVHKGPTSALYGNFNRAGLIDFRTRKGGSYLETDLSAGAYSTFDAQAAYGARLGESQLNAAAQLYRSDGFRPDSQYGKGTVAGRLSLPLTGRLQVAVSGRAHEGSWDSSSYLGAAQFAADPTGKDPRVVGDGGDKRFYTARVDANYALADDLKLLGFVYGTRQGFTRWFTRPVAPTAWRQREEAYDRDVLGAGVNLNGRTLLAGMPLTWVTGIESYTERTEYDQFDGTSNRSRAGAATVNDRRYRFDSNALFGEAEWELARWLRPTLGVRYDRFSGACTPREPETTSEPCATMKDYEQLSPKVGVRSEVVKGLELRASYAEGFALPDGSAKYASGSDLRANDLRQTELGITLKPTRAWQADLALYRLLSANEIRAVSPGVFENFGSTRRTGVEAQLSWFPAPDWEALVGFATADSEVTRNANAALVGRQVTGVPERTATARVAYRPLQGWGAGVSWRHVGRFAVDAANSTFNPSFNLVDAQLSYGARTGNGRRYRLYANVSNLLDKAYAANAFVISGEPLFSPGAPRTVMVGIQGDLQ
ncbi:MAG: TonB-dependent receptor [Lautropia sp.]